MTHEASWNTFIDELRAYVQDHHHFPNKHTRLLSKVKYTRILRQAQEPFFDKITNLLRQAHQPPSTGSGTSFDRLRNLLRQAQEPPSTGSGTSFK